MDFANHAILLGAALVLISILLSIPSRRIGMPLLLAFLLLGMLAGPEGPGRLELRDLESAYLVGSLALAVILFDGGLRTRAQTFRVGLWPALSLATLGVLLTAAVTGVVARWVFALGWMEALLVGAIVGSTDAAAVFALLHMRGLELKQRISATLEIESGANDPMAIFLTLVLVQLLAAGATGAGLGVLAAFAQQMGLGLLAGWAGGRALLWLINHLPLAPSLYPLLALAGALLLFAATNTLGGSGFLAVYLAGIVLGNHRLQGSQNILRFHDGIAWLSQIGMFLMLGLLVTPSDLLVIAPAALVVALALMLLARPLAVAVSLAPFRFPWREQAFIGWMGLRGAVPIILALFPLLAELPDARLFFNVAFFVVLVSLVVQGWTLAPAARLLGLEIPSRPGRVRRVELDLPGQLDYELVAYALVSGSPALGETVDRLGLPAGAGVAGLLRRGEALPQCEGAVLAEGDMVLLLAREAELEALDRLFVPAEGPARLSEARFFGEFALNAEARLGDLAAVYGFTPPAEARESTLGALFARTFNRRPVIGDRIDLGQVALVVREMEGERITKVGLKLAR